MCASDAKEKRALEEKRARKLERLNSFFNGGRPVCFPATPRRFAEKTIDSYIAKTDKQHEIKTIARRYVESFDRVLDNGTGMILAGTPGTGKTHIAWGIVNELRDMEVPAALIQASTMTGAVKDTYSRDSEHSAEQVVSTFADIDLLVIDEVGVQVQTDSEKRIFFDIINRRYEDMKPTIIITNLTIQETAQYIGERVIDRMREGGGVIFAMDWESFRK